MTLKNNNFTADVWQARSTRFDHLRVNIDKLAPEMNLPQDIIDWAKTSDVYDEMHLNVQVEKGMKSSKVMEFRDTLADLKAQYQRCKDLTKSLAGAYANAREILKSYNLTGTTPVARDAIETHVNDFIRQYDKYAAASEPWVIPAAFVDDLRDKLDTMTAAYGEAIEARAKLADARRAVKDRFDSDTRKLQYLFNLGVMLWGRNDLRLERLGFVRKQSIWTAHRPPTPHHLEWDATTRQLSWGGIDGADTYEAQWRASDAHKGDHWTVFYDGEEARCTVPAEFSAGGLRVRAIANGKESHWSKVISI